jgi:hypothetical protein
MSKIIALILAYIPLGDNLADLSLFTSQCAPLKKDRLGLSINPRSIVRDQEEKCFQRGQIMTNVDEPGRSSTITFCELFTNSSPR